MQFQAKTEKQIIEDNLIPAGIYPFEVMESEDKKSKKGNDMIALELRVFMPDGKERSVKDWLLESMAFKLLHFCKHTGIIDRYESCALNAHDCQGKSGWVEIIIQEDKTGQYPPRNSVKDYVAKPEAKTPAAAAKTNDPLADDLPPF